ncbi:ABC transporter ATP-binding protein [Sediminibacterium roseum]|uniref:ABC transporter ATP-binding protein n=1 Tax=Sediminibacterium roseum TaxID=1978412 RepID=A0ABW9ZXP0_9BACT|nr:ABC transporter ATP-binding protein [Sediminibacterium roseum]NCI51933.1 ABC transporter ATP-binding protein [Sediminibacterium roseum]
MLQFNTVQKFYGDFLAMDIPSLSIPSGVYWLKGENGSGKTSFLKMIGGLHPFNGDILLDGTSIKRNRVSFLQKVNYAEAEPLYPQFLTGKDMVNLYCKTKKAAEKDALQLLEQLHILDACQRPVGTYSSGMLKKLSLVLAFIGNAEWILLDEPLITVDKEAVAVICKLINDLHAERNTSFIITSHQPFQHDALMPTIPMIAANKTILIGHE